LHRSKITEYLQDLGLVSKDEKASANVSNYLSTAKELFVTDNSGNWSLPMTEGKEPGTMTG
jgi:hypothetical protein